MNLDAIPDERHASIKEALEDGDGSLLSTFAYPNGALQFVADNAEFLMRHGLYEQCLFIAYKIFTPIRGPLSSSTEAGRKYLKETIPSAFYATKTYSQSMLWELFLRPQIEIDSSPPETRFPETNHSQSIVEHLQHTVRKAFEDCHGPVNVPLLKTSQRQSTDNLLNVLMIHVYSRRLSSGNTSTATPIARWNSW
jgi:hypothetical protein